MGLQALVSFMENPRGGDAFGWVSGVRAFEFELYHQAVAGESWVCGVREAYYTRILVTPRTRVTTDHRAYDLWYTYGFVECPVNLEQAIKIHEWHQRPGCSLPHGKLHAFGVGQSIAEIFDLQPTISHPLVMVPKFEDRDSNLWGLTPEEAWRTLGFPGAGPEAWSRAPQSAGARVPASEEDESKRLEDNRNP